MKGRNFSIRIQRTKYVVTDFVMSSVAFFLFNIYRFYSVNIPTSNFSTLPEFIGSEKLILEQIFIPIFLLGIYWLSGYYNHPFDKSRVTEFSTTLNTSVVSTALIYLLMLVHDISGFKKQEYTTILVLFGLLMGFVYVGRLIVTRQTIHRLKKRKWIYSTLVIGNSTRSRDIYRKLKKSGSEWAYNVVGFIRIPKETQVDDGMPTWSLEDVERVCREESVDQIIIATEKNDDEQIMKLLTLLFPLDKPVKIVPDTLSYVTANIHLNDILGTPLIDLTSPRINEFQKNLKRTSDIIVSAMALLLLSPVLLLTAIGVKRSSPGPVLYRQERIGRGRKPFMIYKFRSMRVDAEKDGPQLSSGDDDRITPFGRFMRKYRIDEFPQFWNVILGDMSLVGPRPEREFYIRQIMARAPYYGLIFQVRPGITSWGMVKYGYASTVKGMVKRSRYDLLYINNMSITTDIKILIYTIRTVFKGAGV